jgi:MFS family permease
MAAERRDVVWNFGALTVDFVAFSVGLAFYDPFVVVPAFVKEFFGSELMVGVLSALRVLMITLPQMWAASVLVARPRKKPLLVWSSLGGRLPVLFLAFATLLWTRQVPVLVVAALSVSAVLFFTSEGLNGISWPAIVGKVIPARVRGRFFGFGQLFSSLGALVAGYVVRLILAGGGGVSDPSRWAILFLCAFVGMMLSLLAILGIREKRDDEVVVSRIDIGLAIKAMLGYLRAESWLRRVVVTQLVLGTASAVFPFFVVRATEAIPGGEQMVGSFLVMQNVGGVVAALVCGHLIDHVGSWSAIRLVSLAQAISLLSVIAADFLGFPEACYLGAFFLLGFVSGSSWWSFNSYLLDMASEVRRPIYLAASGILTSPTFLGSILVGGLFEVLAPQVVFGAALCVGVAGLILAWAIPTGKPPATAS